MNFILPENIRSLLFPARYREFAHKRLVLGMLRAMHILCFTILVGGHYFRQDPELLILWGIGTVVTGTAMYLIGLYGSCMALFEIQSIAVLIKILLLSCLLFVDEVSRVVLLMLLIVFSSLISHATRRIRHVNLMPQAFQDKYGFQKENA